MESNNFIQTTNIDYNYMILNRGLKYFIFLVISLVIIYHIINGISADSFFKTLFISTLSVGLFYILDLTFPSCYISCKT